MAQPSVLRYFNCRKRAASEDTKLDRPTKLLKVNEENPKLALRGKHITDLLSNKELVTPLTRVVKHIDEIKKNTVGDDSTATNEKITEVPQENNNVTNTKEIKESSHLKATGTNEQIIKVTQKSTNPTDGKDIKELNHMKDVLRKHKKYALLKQSLEKFKKSSEKLEALEKRKEELLASPKLKKASSIEFEVPVSPKKTQSPVKSRPTDGGSNLQLPFKYRTLNEIFRAIDTIVQIMHNRQEIITFKKLKPAVEELVKRNFQKTHLAQIKYIYPSAYDLTQKRLKSFGARLAEEWDLVLRPTIQAQTMTTQELVERRRQFQSLLITRVKNHHSEFLSSLTPPLIISNQDLTNWHPEFELEKVPDIELAHLPETPSVDVHRSGKQVLECARRLFNNNVRMNQVPNLEAVCEKQEQQAPTMKGIPEALLKKVRQKQAEKALIAMTTTVEKKQEVQVYSRLPEIARFVRNMFVTEKKSVLQLDVVLEKLSNSYRTFLNKDDMVYHLKVISSKVPGWLVFHTVRNCVFLKLDKNADLSGVLNKLEKLASQIKES